MTVSIREVATLAGVSPATVSNVLNGRRSRDDAIGISVLAAVAALDYHVNEAASNLRRSRSRIIGMIVPDLCNPFFARLVDSVQRVAGAVDYRVFAASSHESITIETEEIASLRRWKVAGLVIAPAGDGSRYADGRVLSDTPGVVLDRVAPGCAFDSVGIDNAAAATGGIERLVTAGHRRILVTFEATSAPNLLERLGACRLAAAASGVHLLEWASPHLDEAGVDPETDARLATFFDRPARPTAVFSMSILTTLQAMRVLGRLGLRTPEDVSLLGFDDSRWLEGRYPAVAAIAQPVAGIAEAGWQALALRIDQANDIPGAETARAGPRRYMLECTPRWRGSIGPAPGGPGRPSSG